MKKTFGIKVFNDGKYQWLFVLDNDVLELFNLIDGTSERCHLAAVGSFEWEVDRKGRYKYLIKSRIGFPILKSLHILFVVTPELEAEARAFSALVMDAAGKYVL